MAKKVNPMLAIVGGLFAVLLIFSIIAIAFYPGPSVVEAEDGDTVSVHYIGKYENGTVFDSNMGEDGKAPFTFIIGHHQVITGFEKAVIGMKPHESKTVTIPPEDAYPYDSDKVVTFMNAEMIEQLGYIPSVGETLMRSNGFSTELGIVTEVTPTTVIVDFNRAVAGKTLVFEITVVDIVKGEVGSH